MSEHTTNIDMAGLCPSCGVPGPLGQPCKEKICIRRGYHVVPSVYATAQLKRETRQIDPLVGCVIGDYLIVDTIGAGGFGRVYLALQMPVRRRPLKVALKVIDVGREARPETVSAMLQKFEAEADALASLSHPNIVRLIKYGRHDQSPYIIMEFVAQGRTLQSELESRLRRRQNFALGEATHILRQVINGLEEAHDEDIIHRDIKPDNIMLQEVAGDANFVRLLDFGLAKFVDERQETSMAVGTPMYMAPEQLLKSSIGAWTDIYAMGVMAFELFTGRRAFIGDFQDIYQQKLDYSYNPLWRTAGIALPEEAIRFFQTAMSVNPDERYQSCSQFRAAMEQASQGLQRAGLQEIDLRGLLVAADGDASVDPTQTAGITAPGASTPAPERPEARHHVAQSDTIQAAPVATSQPRPDDTMRPKLALAKTHLGDSGEQVEAAAQKTAPVPDSHQPTNPWLRMLSFALVIAAIGLLVAVYLRGQQDRSVTSIQAYGATSATAGTTAVLSMSGHRKQSKEPLPVSVEGVTINGRSVAFDIDEGSPSLLSIDVPPHAKGDLAVEINATCHDETKVLSTRMTVREVSLEAAKRKLPERIFRRLQPGEENAISLLPEHQVLTRSMTNRLFVRIRDMRGGPIADSTITLRNKRLVVGGETQMKSDANGLAVAQLALADLPIYTVQVSATKGIAGYTDEPQVVTDPRNLQLRVEPPVATPTLPPTAKLISWKRSAPAHCEVLSGETVVWATRVATTNTEASFRLPAFPEGRYDLQCYDYSTLGEQSWASVPIIVSSEKPVKAILDEVKRYELPKGVSATLPEGANAALTIDYWLAVLRAPFVPPKQIINTRKADLDTLSAEQKRHQLRVLTALGVAALLLVLWVVDGILKTVITTRERLREFDDADTSSSNRLVRVRGLLLIIVLVGSVGASIVALVWLIVSST